MDHSNQLRQIANNLVQKGKGILAADESNPTCKKRFDSIGIESNFNTRNEYRDLLFTSEKIEEYISGVILFDETELSILFSSIQFFVANNCKISWSELNNSNTFLCDSITKDSCLILFFFCCNDLTNFI